MLVKTRRKTASAKIAETMSVSAGRVSFSGKGYGLIFERKGDHLMARPRGVVPQGRLNVLAGKAARILKCHRQVDIVQDRAREAYCN